MAPAGHSGRDCRIRHPRRACAQRAVASGGHHRHGFDSDGLAWILGGPLSPFDHRRRIVSMSAAVALADHQPVQEHQSAANMDGFRLCHHRPNGTAAEIAAMCLVFTHVGKCQYKEVTRVSVHQGHLK